jgi:hypothetical protein
LEPVPLLSQPNTTIAITIKKNNPPNNFTVHTPWQSVPDRL